MQGLSAVRHAYRAARSRLGCAVATVCAFLLPLAALAAEVRDPNSQMDPVEPHHPLYVLFLILAFGGTIFALYWYYIRGGGGDDKDEQETPK